MKACKVISLYPYFPRMNNGTNNAQSLDEWKNIIKLIYRGEKNFCPGEGVNLDVHFVLNLCENELDKEIQEFVYNYHEKKINKGTIIVHTKDNTNNGFSSLKYVLEKHKKDYVYWCFQEDDHYLLSASKGYIREAIDQLNSNKNVKGVSFSPIKRGPGTHFGGFFGVYHRDNLNIDTFPTLKGVYTSWEGEMTSWLLGNCINKGEAVELLKNYSNVPENWKDLVTYVGCVQNPSIVTNLNDPHFFMVGTPKNQLLANTVKAWLREEDYPNGYME